MVVFIEFDICKVFVEEVIFFFRVVFFMKIKKFKKKKSKIGFYFLLVRFIYLDKESLFFRGI